METPGFFVCFGLILFTKYSCTRCTLYVSCLWDLPFFCSSLHFMWKINWVPFRILQSPKALLSNWSTEIPSQVRLQNSVWLHWLSSGCWSKLDHSILQTPVIRLGKLWGTKLQNKCQNGKISIYYFHGFFPGSMCSLFSLALHLSISPVP